jgi:hypothetical protein
LEYQKKNVEQLQAQNSALRSRIQFLEKRKVAEQGQQSIRHDYLTISRQQRA